MSHDDRIAAFLYGKADIVKRLDLLIVGKRKMFYLDFLQCDHLNDLTVPLYTTELCYTNNKNDICIDRCQFHHQYTGSQCHPSYVP